jgi:hypothetical protein
MLVRKTPKKKGKLILAMYYDSKGDLTVVRRKGLTPTLERALCEQVLRSHALSHSISGQ